MSRTEWVRDTLINTGVMHEAHADRAMAEVRAEVLAENLTAPERQFLTFALGLAADHMASRSDEFTAGDEAALTSLRRLAASSPRTAADEQPEFAVRWPDGELTRAADREHGLRAIEVAHRVEPGAVLVHRSCTEWTEVPS